MAYEIEKGKKPKTPSTYPFGMMTEVGDSFFVETETTPRDRSRITSSARIYSLKHPGMKFSVQKSTKDGKAGFRVYRIQ